MSQEINKLNKKVDLGLSNALGLLALGERPTIAITPHLSSYGDSVAHAYSAAIREAGGLPLILPSTDQDEVILSYLEEADGLLLSGGADLLPYYLDQDPSPHLGEVQKERDLFELKLIHLAGLKNIPTLGICRGMQLLGVAYGASLYQDLPSEYEGKLIGHNTPIPRNEVHHKIEIEEGSRLGQLFAEPEVWVNSLHHQAIKEASYPFRVVARSRDGVVEAIDAWPEKDILAVQWHPEQLALRPDEVGQMNLKLFQHLVTRARLYKRARAFHREHIILDSHTDTPMLLNRELRPLDLLEEARVDLNRLRLGDVSTTVMVAYLPQGAMDKEGHQWAQQFAWDKLEVIQRHVAESEGVVLATTPEEILAAKRASKLAIVPGIENGYALGEDLEQLEKLTQQYKIAYITLCHNGDNAICDSARKSLETHHGLSPFGREVVSKMNELGVMIDVSHAADKTVWDTLELSSKPIIASHSSVRAICQHPRNLSNELIEAIAQRGGVVQVCLYSGFIREEGEGSLLDAADHIEHIIKLVGVQHVGIGSDFDGDGELIGLRNSADLIRLTIELLERGYSEEELSLIWGGNFLRVMQEVQA